MTKPGVITIPTKIAVREQEATKRLEAGPPKVILQNPLDSKKVCVVCNGAVYTGDKIAIHGESFIGPPEEPEYFVPTAHRNKNAFQLRTVAAVTIN